MTTSDPEPEPRLPHLIRPGGRVQVGVGPGSWLVEGWLPRPDSSGDPASQLLRRLAGQAVGAPGRAARLSATVSGDGQLAVRLRRAVGRADLDVDHAGPAEGSTAPVAAARAADLPGDRAPLVVLVSHYLVPVGSARRPDLRGRRLLPVVEQTGRVVVGPWLAPPAGPCLHCLDLHRRDRDAEWPAIAAQLEDPLTSPPPPLHPPEVLDVVEALVVLLVLAAARAAGIDTAVCYEVGAETPHVVTRRWTVHPVCPWHRPR